MALASAAPADFAQPQQDIAAPVTMDED